jgi:hypothetical protein
VVEASGTVGISWKGFEEVAQTVDHGVVWRHIITGYAQELGTIGK